MASNFYTKAVNGFTLRVYYEQKGGKITITDVKLRSQTYKGTWYPGGKITVNGVTVLEMNYNSPATHAFNFYSAGDSFISWQVLTGQSLPVTSQKIQTENAEIKVEVTLYRDSSTAKTSLSGSANVTMETTEEEEEETGLIYLDDGQTVSGYVLCIDNGSSWGEYAAQVDNGSAYVAYG